MAFEIRDREKILSFLWKNPFLYLCEIGYLDDFFWTDTNWFALQEEDRVRELVLVYRGGHIPTFSAFSAKEIERLGNLISEILARLPVKLFARLSYGLEVFFKPRFRMQHHGLYHKMGLKYKEKPFLFPTETVEKLSSENLAEIKDLYQLGFPGNWFESKMLDTGFYFGARERGKLVCIAGVLMNSASYRVSLLGNIFTHPDFRGKGLAVKTCARLCQELLKTSEFIGLNVRAGNIPAIECYKKLGFERIASYDEFSMTAIKESNF